MRELSGRAWMIFCPNAISVSIDNFLGDKETLFSWQKLPLFSRQQKCNPTVQLCRSSINIKRAMRTCLSKREEKRALFDHSLVLHATVAVQYSTVQYSTIDIIVVRVSTVHYLGCLKQVPTFDWVRLLVICEIQSSSKFITNSQILKFVFWGKL